MLYRELFGHIGRQFKGMPMHTDIYPNAGHHVPRICIINLENDPVVQLLVWEANAARPCALEVVTHLPKVKLSGSHRLASPGMF